MEAAAARVRIVDFFWADPDPGLVDLAHRNRALACWQVGSLVEAQAAADAGCDAIAVQGTEAGGHIRGQDSLLPLLETVIGQFDLPVLAAGGIGSGRAFADILNRGAAGAWVGTFSVCPLCATVPRARVLRACIDAVRDLPGDTVGEAMVGQQVSLPKGHGLPPGTAATGHIDAMPLYAGESAAAVSAVESAAVVIQSWSSAAGTPWGALAARGEPATPNAIFDVMNHYATEPYHP